MEAAFEMRRKALEANDSDEEEGDADSDVVWDSEEDWWVFAMASWQAKRSQIPQFQDCPNRSSHIHKLFLIWYIKASLWRIDNKLVAIGSQSGQGPRV